MHFEQFPLTIDIDPLVAQIAANPQLWNMYRERKDSHNSPHAEMSDIWLRYRPKNELTDPSKFAEPHIPAWYPARELLPDAEKICLDLMAYFRCVQLGGVLITKIPPGGIIARHNDKGTWHPEFFNCKVYVPLASNDGCINECEGDEVNMKAGEVWSFNNLEEHSVFNNGTTDRVTLIVCMRKE